MSSFSFILVNTINNIKRMDTSHLYDGLLLGCKVLLHILLQSSQHHWLQNALQFLNLRHKCNVSTLFCWELKRHNALQLTCSSVFRSPNSVMNVCSDGNRSGSRKFSKLKSSSTVFWRGVPVNKTLCSWRRKRQERHPVFKIQELVRT